MRTYNVHFKTKPRRVIDCFRTQRSKLLFRIACKMLEARAEENDQIEKDVKRNIRNER